MRGTIATWVGIKRCWVHLLRDLHELKEKHAQRADVLEWAEKVRQLYEDAEHFVKTMLVRGQVEREQHT